ncbi:MAG TPA: hypothetical protein PKG48_14850, partial [Bacteroidales bacterium]|nr:hypothetical protein [Bacteroidales bacterium]
MKKIIPLALIAIYSFSIVSCKKDDQTPDVTPPPVVKRSDSLSLSANYVNEVYYSFTNGVVQTSPRSTWDIAFRTMKRSSSILINDGAGVVLYTYPYADTTGWAVIDT